MKEQIDGQCQKRIIGNVGHGHKVDHLQQIEVRKKAKEGHARKIGVKVVGEVLSSYKDHYHRHQKQSPLFIDYMESPGDIVGPEKTGYMQQEKRGEGHDDLVFSEVLDLLLQVFMQEKAEDDRHGYGCSDCGRERKEKTKNYDEIKTVFERFCLSTLPMGFGTCPTAISCSFTVSARVDRVGFSITGAAKTIVQRACAGNFQ